MLGLFDRFVKLHYKITHDEEEWEFTEEPHVSRRQEILKKYPEIKKLMGFDPNIAIYVTIEVLIQFAVAWYMQDASWPKLVIASYVISGTLNHSLGSAIHEIGHNMAFGHRRPSWNRILGLWANLPYGVPFSVTYRKYHADHHRFLGHDTMDVDIPSVIESYLFRNPVTKCFWLIMHPVIHALRPYMKSPKPVWAWEVINFVVQIAFDALVLRVLGVKSLIYFLLGTFFGMGFHPLAGHFISEHYLFNKGQATTSYYGPLNFIMFNLGYHVEHHDFPYIPYTKLPEVRRIAKEFYEPLPYHTSWVKVLWDFIFDYDMGPHARGVGFLKDENKDPNCIREQQNGKKIE